MCKVDSKFGPLQFSPTSPSVSMPVLQVMTPLSGLFSMCKVGNIPFRKHWSRFVTFGEGRGVLKKGGFSNGVRV